MNVFAHVSDNVVLVQKQYSSPYDNPVIIDGSSWSFLMYLHHFLCTFLLDDWVSNALQCSLFMHHADYWKKAHVNLWLFLGILYFLVLIVLIDYCSIKVALMVINSPVHVFLLQSYSFLEGTVGHISVSDTTICPHHHFAWQPQAPVCTLHNELSQRWV